MCLFLIQMYLPMHIILF